MSNLEKIVPPLELCRQIPAGEFENSAMVWVKSDPAGCVHCTGKWHVCLREGAELSAYNKWMPAPTLEEILSAFEGYAMPELVYMVDPPSWRCAAGNSAYQSASAVKSAMKVYLANKEDW